MMLLARGQVAIAAIALHLTTSASPSMAILVCVSDHGDTAIELAEPGTVRCCDRACEPVAARPDQHSCRDIPVLSAADAVATAAAASLPPPVVCHDVGLEPGHASAALITLGHALPPPPDAVAHQSIVLTL